MFTYQTTLHINNKKPPQSASESLRCINTPQIRVIPAELQQTMILISVFWMKASLWRSFHPSPVRIFVPMSPPRFNATLESMHLGSPQLKASSMGR